MAKTSLVNPVLLVGCLIILVSFAIRASFGVFQIPIAQEFGWLRAEFSLAIAIQNLAWGIGQPIFGAIAEKIGDKKAIVIGALVYAVGLIFSSYSSTPGAHQINALLIGLGIAGTGFGVILAVVGRASSDENRSMSLAIVTAAGSTGQVFGPPLAEWLLMDLSWQLVFLIFSILILSTLLFLPLMEADNSVSKKELEESLGDFVTAHFPAMVTEMCGAILPGTLLHYIGITTTSALGALALSLVGLANIFGTLAAGYLGNFYQKKYLLSLIYLGRTLIGAIFILMPITPLTVIIFSVTMGSLWLATVPLTSGLIAHIYGLRYMGTLYGIVFFSHQLGSFLGVWLGGRMYDTFGDYTAVWWIGVGVGAFSAIIHLPIKEKSQQTLTA